MTAQPSAANEAPALHRTRKRLSSIAVVFTPAADPSLDQKRLADAGAFFRRLGQNQAGLP